MQPSAPRIRTIAGIPRRTVWATAILVLFLASWFGYGWLTAPGRLSPALSTALASDPTAYQDVAVSLGFPPRQFHIRLFQRYGTFAGVDGTTVKIRRVAPAQIQEIARTYWVDRVDLASLP